MNFICPTCKTTLDATPARYLCPTCETRYPVRDAIPDFWPQAGDYYWGEVPEPIAWQATELLRCEGFDAAVRLISSHNPDMAAYLTEDKRIDWLFHCLDNLTLDSCLDLGSGWGSLSVRLSHFFRHVWSLDGTWPRLRFQQAYAERRGARNLRLVRGNLFPLPFPDQSFDLVVSNGVLEWVGLVNLDRPVTELQSAFLREIYRVLKPNGILYIGVENRFGFGNFAGSRDHSGLPYTALLPRRLASLAVRWFRRPDPDEITVYRTAARWRDYRTYTYSLRGYRQLLRRAGFAATSFAWAWPSYNLPWLSGNVENSRALGLFLDFMRTRAMVYLPRRNWRQRLLRWGAAFPARSWVVAALRWFVPSFLIFARRQASIPLALPYLQISGVHKLVAIAPSDGGELTATKQPRFPADSPAFEQEQSRSLRFNPALTARRVVRRQLAAYVEPYLEGIAPDATSMADQRVALLWLLNFQRQTHSGVWKRDELEHQVQRDLQAATPRLDELGLKADITAGCRNFLAWLRDTPLARVAEHGDFWKGNLILQPPDRLYVLDWEHFRDPGEPFFDLFFFLYSHYCYGSFFSPGRTFLRAYRRNTPFLLAEFASAYRLQTSDLLTYLPYFTVRYLLRGTPLPEQIKPFGEQLRSWLEHRRLAWMRTGRKKDWRAELKKPSG